MIWGYFSCHVSHVKFIEIPSISTKKNLHQEFVANHFEEPRQKFLTPRKKISASHAVKKRNCTHIPKPPIKTYENEKLLCKKHRLRSPAECFSFFIASREKNPPFHASFLFQVQHAGVLNTVISDNSGVVPSSGAARLQPEAPRASIAYTLQVQQ